MKINDSRVTKHIEVSKELEIINFRTFQDNLLGNGNKEGCTKHWMLDESKTDDKGKNKVKDQFTSFQNAMKVLLVWGQCVGLNPVSGILQKDVSKMRFTVFSWKFLYTVTMAIAQTITVSLCFYRLFSSPVSSGNLALITFFSTTFCTMIAFIRIAAKWPTLMQEVSNSNLDKYIDPKLIKKCNIACMAFIGLAVTEHISAILARVARIFDCKANANDYVEEFVKLTSPWLNGLNVPNSKALGILLQYMNLTATATWNYSDMFIVCMSLYLTSILEQINQKIVLAADQNFMPTSLWEVLREDYTRATRLIRMFDDAFSSIILVSFASDLFFICLQLYNLLANGVKSVQTMTKVCSNYPSGPLKGYEYSIYLTYSTIFLFIRFLTVSLVAAGVNTASLEPATVLYRIPTSAYTKEAERFLHQVNGDVVALSGLQFFYITRELVLSVAGTIVTYELVLLQFSSEEFRN